MEPIKQIEYKDCKINIYQDEHCESPNDWEDEDVFLVYDHRDFTVKRDRFYPEEIQRNIVKKAREYNIDNSYLEEYYIFPVSAYIHSGISLSLSNEEYPFTSIWDTSMKGFVLVLKNCKEDTFDINVNEEEAKDKAENLIKTWNQYLSGDVYGYMVETPNGEEQGGCWGYYGHNFEENDLINTAKMDIDNAKVEYKKLITKSYQASLKEILDFKCSHDHMKGFQTLSLEEIADRYLNELNVSSTTKSEIIKIVTIQ